MTLHTYGNKLDGSILSEKAWRKFKHSVESREKPLDIEAKREVFEEFKALTQEFCVGENEHKCLLCGEPQNRAEGLCTVCYKAFVDRGVLRQCGTIHGCTQKDVLCSACGENLGYNKGVCRKCYWKMNYHHLKNVDELKEFLRKNKGELNEDEIQSLPLTSVR